MSFSTSMPFPQHNSKTLRHLFDQVESHMRGLRSLGVPPETYDSLLSSILVNKLPPELHLIISRDVKDKEWDLSGLMKVMECKIDARGRVASQPLKRQSSPLLQPCSLENQDQLAPIVTNLIRPIVVGQSQM